MRYKAFFISVFFCLLSYQKTIQGQEMKPKNIIAAAELSMLFNLVPKIDNEGHLHQGAYFDLISHILKITKLDQDYELVVYPIKRAKYGFKYKKFACFSPGFETYSEPEKTFQNVNILSSSPINQALVRVVSADDHRLITKIEDINKNDKISYVAGIPISKAMRAMIDRAGAVYAVGSEVENLKMLMLKRATVSFIFYPDVLGAYERLNIDSHFPYDKTFFPETIQDNIICHPEHKTAFEIINAKLSEMKASGQLKQLLGSAYLEEHY